MELPEVPEVITSLEVSGETAEIHQPLINEAYNRGYLAGHAAGFQEGLQKGRDFREATSLTELVDLTYDGSVRSYVASIRAVMTRLPRGSSVHLAKAKVDEELAGLGKPHYKATS